MSPDHGPPCRTLKVTTRTVSAWLWPTVIASRRLATTTGCQRTARLTRLTKSYWWPQPATPDVDDDIRSDPARTGGLMMPRIRRRGAKYLRSCALPGMFDQGRDPASPDPGAARFRELPYCFECSLVLP